MSIQWDNILWENLDKNKINNQNIIDYNISQFDEEIMIENYSTKKKDQTSFSIYKEKIIFLDKDVFDSQINSMYVNKKEAEKQFLIDMHRSDLYINNNYCRHLRPEGVINYLDYSVNDKKLNKKIITCLTQSILSIPIYLIHSKITDRDLYIGEIDSIAFEIKKAMQIHIDLSNDMNIIIQKNMRIFNTFNTVCYLTITMDFDLLSNSPVIMTLSPFK